MTDRQAPSRALAVATLATALLFAGGATYAGSPAHLPPGGVFRADARLPYSRDWEVRAMRGPQAAPDFLTETDMETLFGRPWPIDRNSNRTGVRLESHKFEWARRSGGMLSRAQRMASVTAAARSTPSAMAPRTIWTSCLAKRVGISGAWQSMTSPR